VKIVLTRKEVEYLATILEKFDDVVAFEIDEESISWVVKDWKNEGQGKKRNENFSQNKTK
jgi:hypothetical protein